MNITQAYDHWSAQYDANANKTRDLEAVALRTILHDFSFSNGLEIGCGTGKNTVWLVTKTTHLTAIDLSEKMLDNARAKITADHVHFAQADILQDWHFADRTYDLVTFSLVLEHIENLHPIFQKTAKVLANDGYMYIGELHPFKQYQGSKARFETETGTQIVPCFNHHVSDFTQLAIEYGFEIVNLQEYFDENDRRGVPRILTILFKKSKNPIYNTLNNF